MTLVKRSLTPGISTFFNDFFDDDRFWKSDLTSSWANRVPSANILESEKEYTIELAIPGISKKDIKIDIDSGELCIKSEKEDEKEEKGENYTRKEFSYNSFSRSFLLPDTVNTDKIKAKYEDGVLKIALPKKPEVKKITKKEISIN